jgi:protein TonB
MPPKKTLPNYSSFTFFHWLFFILTALLIHAGLLMTYKTSNDVLGANNIGTQGIKIGLKRITPPPEIAEENKIKDTSKDKVIPNKKKTVKPKKSVKKSRPKEKIINKPVYETPKEEVEKVEKEELSVTEQGDADETALEASTASPTKNMVEGKITKAEYSTNRVESISGGGDPKQKITYKKTLLAWLEQHKRYPSAAKRRGQEGVVKLQFTIDEGGNVLSYKIIDASRYGKLNKAVIKMIRNASPLPPIPLSMRKSSSAQFSYSVPIVFTLSHH